MMSCTLGARAERGDFYQLMKQMLISVFRFSSASVIKLDILEE